MTDRLDELLFSIGGEENGRVDFDQMYADLLQKQREEETKRSIRRSRFMRYGAMAACAVALIGIGAAMVNGSRFKAETPAEAAMTEECAEEAAPAEGAPMEEEGTATEAPMVAAAASDTGEAEAPKADPEERMADNAKSQGTALTAAQETAEIGTCADAKSRLKAAGIEAEPYEGDDAPKEGYALMTGEGEAIWNAGSGVYKVTLNGDIAAQLKELCE